MGEVPLSLGCFLLGARVETGSCCVAQSGLEPTEIFLPQPQNCLHSAWGSFLFQTEDLSGNQIPWVLELSSIEFCTPSPRSIGVISLNEMRVTSGSGWEKESESAAAQHQQTQEMHCSCRCHCADRKNIAKTCEDRGNHQTPSFQPDLNLSTLSCSSLKVKTTSPGMEAQDS